MSILWLKMFERNVEPLSEFLRGLRRHSAIAWRFRICNYSLLSALTRSQFLRWMVNWTLILMELCPQQVKSLANCNLKRRRKIPTTTRQDTIMQLLCVAVRQHSVEQQITWLEMTLGGSLCNSAGTFWVFQDLSGVSSRPMLLFILHEPTRICFPSIDR